VAGESRRAGVPGAAHGEDRRVRLAGLMIEHDIGTSETARYVLKRLDEDYFGDGQ
jgi:hypothetical protein